MFVHLSNTYLFCDSVMIDYVGMWENSLLLGAIAKIVVCNRSSNLRNFHNGLHGYESYYVSVHYIKFGVDLSGSFTWASWIR